jgi:hypothetical protein
MDPRCAYCAKGARINEEEVACTRRGIVPAEGKCPAFRYDPLQRVPPRPLQFSPEGLTPEDFEI